jgi:hypothetical protein
LLLSDDIIDKLNVENVGMWLQCYLLCEMHRRVTYYHKTSVIIIGRAKSVESRGITNMDLVQERNQ